LVSRRFAAPSPEADEHDGRVWVDDTRVAEYVVMAGFTKETNRRITRSGNGLVNRLARDIDFTEESKPVPEETRVVAVWPLD